MIDHPRSVLEHIVLRSGMVVCDIGAGAGFYTLAMASLVAPAQVYAVDIQKDILTRLSKDAHDKHLSNVHPLWGDAEKPKGTKLRDELCDVVVISNVLSQAIHKDRIVVEGARILKKGGNLVIVEKQGKQRDNHTAPHDVRAWCEHAGLALHKQFSIGAEHYGMIYTK